MRILLIGPYWFGGWTESVIRALKQHDCEVEVFYYTKTPSKDVAKGVTSFSSVFAAYSPNVLVFGYGEEIDRNIIRWLNPFSLIL